jgi:hypothetical protein
MTVTGTAGAEHNTSMKKPQEVPKSAGPAEQNLPGVVLDAAEQAKHPSETDSQTPVAEVAFGGAMTESPASRRGRSRISRGRESWTA